MSSDRTPDIGSVGGVAARAAARNAYSDAFEA